MCDTFVVLGGLAASGCTTLAKNSDREPNEAQYLTRVAARDHAPGSTVRCTYVELPQAAHTHAVLGSRPWWMWGFEHGVNEHGLAIGNEALFSRLPASTEPGLLGMDLLRLTLERAATAEEGLAVLTGLLERHGQSGRTSATREASYHNSFILADAAEAWILETAGRHWAARRVAGWAAISNVYTIGTDYDRISGSAIELATRSGWFDPAAGRPFDFAAAYADPELPFLPSCAARLAASRRRVARLAGQGPLALEDVFSVLRAHGATEPGDGWRPGADGQSLICMHATAPSGVETAASMVAELPAATDGPGAATPAATLWASLASPCLSSFLPLWLDTGPPARWTQPGAGGPDAWWEREAMQRLVERDYGRLAAAPRAILDRLEAETLAAVRGLGGDAGAAGRRALTERFAARQDAAVRILAALTRACAAELLDPPEADPRGSYLAEVEAERRDTGLPAS